MEKRFKKIHELGRQKRRKFGKTFKGIDSFTQEKVIIKQFFKEENNRHLLEQIQEEATFHFEKEGLPKVITHRENDIFFELILSFKEGIPIDQYWQTLKKRKRIAFLIKLTQQLSLIFDELKLQEIVHCDLKPSNLIIEEKGEHFQVHLIDFGMAVRKNTTRKILFPLGYAPPELILNHLSILDHRSDQFSLGILIWRLYTGKLPLSHPNPSIFTNLQITHPIQNHRKIPKSIFTILEKMCYKHQFALPPNRMKDEDVKKKLLSAMDNRYSSLSKVTNELKQIKPSFYHSISLR